MQYYLVVKGNKSVPFAETWMDLDTIIQTKVIQKEKNKYCMLTYMWNIEKWYR